MVTRISLEEYREYSAGYVGYCTSCREWTGECVEPDAHEYECPACGQSTLYGAEEAFLQGLMEVV